MEDNKQDNIIHEEIKIEPFNIELIPFDIKLKPFKLDVEPFNINLEELKETNSNS